MSSQTYKHLEKHLKKDQNFFNAEVINFPSEKKLNKTKIFNLDTQDFWNIKDETNQDQLKAVTGICFMLGLLIIIGLYSNLL